jgi:2'-5' RNA ligase
MRHRLFIAINLPEIIKNNLSNFQTKYPELPARWTKKQNLHITLVFLGYVNEHEIPEILKTTEEVAKKHNAFSLVLNRICYGPPKKTPRMVWAEGEKSEELGKLQSDLEKSLTTRATAKGEKEDLSSLTTKLSRSESEGRDEVLPSSSALSFKKEGRPYSVHITLARLNQWQFKQIELEERPQIEQDVNLDFEVNSIEIMQSHLKRTGAEYLLLQSIALGE